MLAADEQMRWWGMDVRSRRRRRWAVSLFYLLLFAAFDGIGTTGRWAAHPYIVFSSLLATAVVMARLSIFGKNGPVRDRDRPALRLGKTEYVRVTGLDERARYRFGVESFEAASEEQKNELLNTHRAGRYYMLKERDQTPWLDERELRERDNAERWALRQIITLLAALSGIWFAKMTNHDKLDGYSVVTLLLFVTFMADTLPKARVLWTEPDPREMAGEIALVGRAEGGV